MSEYIKKNKGKLEMKSDKQTTNLKESLKENLQLILAFAAVGGVVVGLLNFYLLTTISPIEKRVAAIEVRNDKLEPLITDYIQDKVVIDALAGDIKSIRTDITTIKESMTALRVAVAKIEK